mmetsp:Transcript_5607/g.7461  ORF Transcript_5607/g.7461 Transcript_5607/m.7461 type:complete len:82 (-) Transcript_5607:1815-2060(-)
MRKTIEQEIRDEIAHAGTFVVAESNTLQWLESRYLESFKTSTWFHQLLVHVECLCKSGIEVSSARKAGNEDLLDEKKIAKR